MDGRQSTYTKSMVTLDAQINNEYVNAAEWVCVNRTDTWSSG